MFAPATRINSPTSSPSVALAIPVQASDALKSAWTVRTSTPYPRHCSAVCSNAAAVRATSTRFRPACASSRANSAPTPSEPPAISAHGPYFAVSITGLTRDARLRGGVNDQHVDLGSARDVGGHRSQQPAGDRAQADVADDEQVVADLFCESDQRVHRRADD